MEKVKLAASKITGMPARADVDGFFPVIIKVNIADYVPDGISVRSKISSYIFTASVRQTDLKALDNNKRVVSIAISQPLQIIK